MNFRKKFLQLKEGFLDAKAENLYDVYLFANQILICFTSWIITCISSIFVYIHLDYIFYIITTLSFFSFIFFSINHRAFLMIMPFSAKILIHFFGRYGRVVTKQDWTRIKKESHRGYREIWSKNSIGHCYYFSWYIALFLNDATLMYCSIKGNDGRNTAHSVIVKNNCVYDTNARQHFDLNDYNLPCKFYYLFSWLFFYFIAFNTAPYKFCFC